MNREINPDILTCECGHLVVGNKNSPSPKWFCEGCGMAPPFCTCHGGPADGQGDGEPLVAEQEGVCKCGSLIVSVGTGTGFNKLACEACSATPMFCMCPGGSPHQRHEKTLREVVAQEQPQPHGTGQPVGERLIELIRERTKLGIEKYGEPLTTHNGRDPMLDALQESIDLNQYLMQALMESVDEVKRLSEEQIGELATFLLEYGTIPKPEEGACATAIRVISELTGGD